MQHIKKSAVLIVLCILFQAVASAIGPPNLDEPDVVSKTVWDNSVVLTGIVRSVKPTEGNWKVMEVEVHRLISGQFDPAKHGLIKVGFAESIITSFSIPYEGDTIVLACYEKAKGEPDDRLMVIGNGDYGVQEGSVALDKTRFSGLRVLERPGMEADKTKNEAILLLLSQKVRELRAYKK